MGDDADRAAYVETPARRTCCDHGDALGDDVPRARRGQPAAGPRLEGPRLAGRHRARAADHRVTSATTPARTSRRCSTGSTALGIEHEINPRLVRGLDYYTSTTFEFSSQALDAAQNGIGGGGRYDGLVEQMGGKPTPGIGFGIGIERVLIACAAEGSCPVPTPAADVFVVDGIGQRHRGDAAASPSCARTACAPSAPTAAVRSRRR